MKPAPTKPAPITYFFSLAKIKDISSYKFKLNKCKEFSEYVLVPTPSPIFYLHVTPKGRCGKGVHARQQKSLFSVELSRTTLPE